MDDNYVEIMLDDAGPEDFARMPLPGTWTEYVMTNRGAELRRHGLRGWLQRRRARRYSASMPPLCGPSRYSRFVDEWSHYAHTNEGCLICASMRERGITPPPCPGDRDAD